MLFAGLGCMIASLFARSESTKTILLGLTGLFYIAAGIQIVIYKKRPNSFGPKNGAGVAGKSAGERSEGRG